MGDDWRCPGANCGKEWPDTIRFCKNCGSPKPKLEAAAAGPPAEPVPAVVHMPTVPAVITPRSAGTTTVEMTDITPSVPSLPEACRSPYPTHLMQV
jgi:hypothetical protein